MLWQWKNIYYSVLIIHYLFILRVLLQLTLKKILVFYFLSDPIDLRVLLRWEISVLPAQSGCRWPAVHKSQGFVLQINPAPSDPPTEKINYSKKHWTRWKREYFQQANPAPPLGNEWKKTLNVKKALPYRLQAEASNLNSSMNFSKQIINHVSCLLHVFYIGDLLWHFANGNGLLNPSYFFPPSNLDWI